MISANMPICPYRSIIGNSFDFLTRSILFSSRKTGTVAFFTSSSTN